LQSRRPQRAGLKLRSSLRPAFASHAASGERPSGREPRSRSGSITALPETPTLHRSTYCNPVIDHNFPDPHVILASDGWYYAYGTQDAGAVRTANIQVARSRDLVAWNMLGDALPQLPSWADVEPTSWAPHVLEHGGRFLLYFSTTPNDLAGEDAQCLAVAASSSPAGPFAATDEPLYRGPTHADIDLAVFQDPQSGEWFGYWGSGGDAVACRMSPDLLAFDGSEPEVILRAWTLPADEQGPYENGAEGQFVVHRDGWYYLFTSGDRCCEYPPSYAVLVARSRSPLGPFERYAEATGRQSSAILEGNDRWTGPGHCSVIRDAAGDDWIVYHGIDTHPDRRFLTGSGMVRRVMLIDRLVYTDGWPAIEGGTPSTGRVPGPVTRL